MKISFQQAYIQPNFSAKKPEIRKADDIQRKAKANFPMFSPSYLREFYILPKKCVDDTKLNRTRQIAQRIVYKINAARECDRQDLEYCYKWNPYRKEIPYTRTLQRIKGSKIGNCEEASCATMATLAANGYYDSKRMSLVLKGQLVNKKTKKIEYTTIPHSLDHAFVVSSLGKENATEKDLIVLDSWYGFADSISKAKEKYQKLADNPKVKNDIKEELSLYRVDYFSETGKILDWNDYDIKYSIQFKEKENYTENDIKALGIHARMIYPHLCL